MQTALWLITFGISLALLIATAKVFVRSSQDLAKAMGWSSFFVGLTIVALGTSLPELATSIWASMTQKTAVVSANVVGSNIANILLILGFSAVMAKTVDLSSESIRRQMGVFFISAILLTLTLYDGQFLWIEGILLLSGFIAYNIFNYEDHKAGRFEALKNWALKREVTGKMIGLVLASGFVTIASSYLTIYALEQVATLTNTLTSVIGASLLAIGTSLPEFTTVWLMIKQKNSDLAVGTLVGSNILNATLVMAIPSFFRNLNVNSDILIVGIPFLLIATVLLLFAVSQRKLHAYEGALYVVLYVLFLQQLFTSF